MYARLAEPTDTPLILKHARTFVSEAHWGWTFDDDAALDTITNFLASPDAAFFVIDAGDDLAGGALLSCTQVWCAEKVGAVHEFFIVPGYRRTPASRLLLQAIDDWFEAVGAAVAFATGTANLSPRETRLFDNLFLKHGYQAVGQSLVRRYEHG